MSRRGWRISRRVKPMLRCWLRPVLTGWGCLIRVMPLTAQMLPAASQGAVGIDRLSARDDLAPLLAAINHVPTFTAVMAERDFLEALGGNCHSPGGGICRSRRRNGQSFGRGIQRRWQPNAVGAISTMRSATRRTSTACGRNAGRRASFDQSALQPVKLLVIRPQPGADATAARMRASGT